MTRDAKADCEALMNAALPVAEQMLATYGEFFPYGNAMRPSGDIVDIASYDGDEHSRSVDVLALLKDGLVAAARDGKVIATAIVFDVRAAACSAAEKSDAIAVSLNHRDGYSVIVFFPYTIDHSRVVLGTAFAGKGEADVFPAKPSSSP